jgi:hypothetical protein
VAEAFENFVQIVSCGETQDAHSILAAAFDVRLEFAISKKESLSDGDLPAGADERFPFVWREGADEKNFNRRFQEFGARGIIFARRCGAKAGAVAEKTRGKDSCVVDNDEFVAAKKIRKLAEVAVVPFAGGAVEQ